MKLTKYLLDNFYAYTFISIVGFTIGSIFILAPNFSTVLEIFISILCITVGLIISSFFKERNV